jgi:hypothetical protein
MVQINGFTRVVDCQQIDTQVYNKHATLIERNNYPIAMNSWTTKTMFKKMLEGANL